MFTPKISCIASWPVGIAYVHNIFTWLKGNQVALSREITLLKLFCLPSEKMKGKNLASKFFLFRVDPFQKGIDA